MMERLCRAAEVSVTHRAPPPHTQSPPPQHITLPNPQPLYWILQLPFLFPFKCPDTKVSIKNRKVSFLLLTFHLTLCRLCSTACIYTCSNVTVCFQQSQRPLLIVPHSRPKIQQVSNILNRYMLLSNDKFMVKTVITYCICDSTLDF